MSHSPYKFDLHIRTERLGKRELTIECLVDLDRTIDEFFEYLQAEGRPSDLERLCPYFGVVWPAARALTEHLADSIAHPEKTRVLEIGCGLAVPSLFLATQGACVTATDFHPAVPDFLSRNLALNSVKSNSVHYVEIDWQELSHGARHGATLGEFDCVIGSDILYERQQPELVAATIERFLAPHGKAFITDPARPYLQTFVDEMEKRGFAHRLSVRRTMDSKGSVSTLQDVFVVEFSRKDNR